MPPIFTGKTKSVQELHDNKKRKRSLIPYISVCCPSFDVPPVKIMRTCDISCFIVTVSPDTIPVTITPDIVSVINSPDIVVVTVAPDTVPYVISDVVPDVAPDVAPVITLPDTIPVTIVAPVSQDIVAVITSSDTTPVITSPNVAPVTVSPNVSPVITSPNVLSAISLNLIIRIMQQFELQNREKKTLCAKIIKLEKANTNLHEANKKLFGNNTELKDTNRSLNIENIYLNRLLQEQVTAQTLLDISEKSD